MGNGDAETAVAPGRSRRGARNSPADMFWLKNSRVTMIKFDKWVKISQNLKQTFATLVDNLFRR